MRFTRMLATVATAMALAATMTVAAQQPTFKASTEAIWVTATVIDRSGGLVTSLGKDDFEIRDNGTVREITAFRNDVVPVAVAFIGESSSCWSKYSSTSAFSAASGEVFGEFAQAVSIAVASVAKSFFMRAW